jgi:hypothetical protein
MDAARSCVSRGARSNPAALTIEKISRWCLEAERGLCESFGGDRDELVAGVEQGTLELWKLNDGKAWMITRVSRGVLVVHCFQGEGLRAIAPAVHRIAQRNGLQAIEFWTARPGLARMLRALRFSPIVTAYRCEVSREH